jgi:hypothetical protein
MDPANQRLSVINAVRLLAMLFYSFSTFIAMATLDK